MSKLQTHLLYAGTLLIIAFAILGTLIYFHRQNQQSIPKTQSSQLDLCLSTAEQGYDDYLRINATETKIDPETGQTLIKNEQHTIDNAKVKLQSDRDECFKRYPVRN